MSSFRLAWLSLWRRQFPTALSLFAIALAVGCSGLLLRLYQLSETRFSTMGAGGDAIVGAKAGGLDILLGSLNAEGRYPDFLPYKLFESLRQQQEVHFEDGAAATPSTIQSIIPFVYFGQFRHFRLVGTDESFIKRPRADDLLLFSEGRWVQQNGEVVLGATVAQEAGLKVGDHVAAQLWLSNQPSTETIDLKVVGLLAATHTMWDRQLYSSVEQAQVIFQNHESTIRPRSIWGGQVLHYFLVYLQPKGFGPLEALVNRRTVGQIIDVETEKARLNELTSVGKDVGFFVTMLVIILGSLAVSAMLVTRFEGLVVQMAVLRALGYTRKEISLWLVWEGFLLGLVGCVIGAVLDAISLPFLRQMLGASLPSTDLVPSSIWNSYPIWIVTLASMILVVLIPLIRVYRQDIHQSLRGL